MVSDTARRLAAFINEEIAKVVGPHSTFEQRQAAACAVMSDTLWFRTDGELRDGLTTADEIEVEDRRYYRLEQASSATYHSPWGSHYVEEALYRDAGVHSGPTIKPLELHIGIGPLERDQPSLVGMQCQAVSAKSSWQHVEESLGISLAREDHDEVILVPNRFGVAVELGSDVTDEPLVEEQLRLLQLPPFRGSIA